eukprot:4508713-Prymnesium_polylepis.1
MSCVRREYGRLVARPFARRRAHSERRNVSDSGEEKSEAAEAALARKSVVITPRYCCKREKILSSDGGCVWL